MTHQIDNSYQAESNITLPYIMVAVILFSRRVL